ncbi:MAG: hypothetical protein R2710_04325 [Acidimicrobiales bacterium]
MGLLISGRSSSDDDGLLDGALEAGGDPANPVDTDGDGTPDFQEIDSDDDGLLRCPR